jgi:hypothetical protein
MSSSTSPRAGRAVPGLAAADPATTTGEPGSALPALLRLGAAVGVVGLVLQVVASLLHPSHAQPNDSAAAFREYAASADWVPVHLGQWLGVLLVAMALVILGRVLAGQPGWTGALAVPGVLTAGLVAAVFTVQMAVDAVALHGAVDAWAGAPAGGGEAAFRVAEGVRGVEKGLSAFFHLLDGATLLLLGLAVALGRAVPRWVGGVGALAGIGYVIGGVVTAYTGFSTTATEVLLVPLALDIVFLLGACWWMWRSGVIAATSAGD